MLDVWYFGPPRFGTMINIQDAATGLCVPMYHKMFPVGWGTDFPGTPI